LLAGEYRRQDVRTIEIHKSKGRIEQAGFSSVVIA
jgi:hypothetical protein